MLIKIIDKGGHEYKLRWIEEQDGNIFSIKNTKRVYFNKNDIGQVILVDPEPRVVPIDQALNHQSVIRLLIKDDKDNYNRHQFIRISESDEIITGYKMTENDTLTVMIPIDQIEMIQLKDKKRSNGRTAGLVVGVGAAVIVVVGTAAMANSFTDHFGWL